MRRSLGIFLYIDEYFTNDIVYDQPGSSSQVTVHTTTVCDVTIYFIIESY
jgi:hypothetical protein